MKLLVWSFFLLLFAAWTGATLLAVSLSAWAADALATGRAADLAGIAAQWPAPAWLAPWIDPQTVRAIQASLVAAVAEMGRLLPWLAALAGWMTPLLWALWALGSLLLLLFAGALHFLVTAFRGKPPAHA